MVGCADCYDTFFDMLLPSIRRIHGNTTHCGKKSVAGIEYTETPDNAEEKPQPKDKLSDLKARLDEAVKIQNFEEAAKLRDEIKAMEDNNG